MSKVEYEEKNGKAKLVIDGVDYSNKVNSVAILKLADDLCEVMVKFTSTDIKISSDNCCVKVENDD
jgi:hypothetical protein